MNKKIAFAIASLVAIGATAGILLTDGPTDPTDSNMPVPGANVADHIVDESGMPVPGEDGIDETIVVDEGPSLGVPAPGYEGRVDETIVVGGTGSAGMAVPGYEGQVDETIVHFEQ